MTFMQIWRASWTRPSAAAIRARPLSEAVYSGQARIAWEEARALEAQGFDWNAHFADFQYPEKGSYGLQTHGVNNAMAMTMRCRMPPDS